MIKQKAFSLVELSVVLVILGLLTGGILAGQGLIRAAELRSVTSEYDRYRTAVGVFRDKYMAIPGDMSNATHFWTQLSAVAATCRNGQSVGTETCDGDGNGEIFITGRSAEFFRFWQHLANAGLIEGSYSGATNGLGGSESDSIGIGQNSPRSRMANGTWFAYSRNMWGAAWWGDPSRIENHLIFGGNTYGSVPMDNLLLTPEEAWNLDSKIDDGKPGTGNVNSFGDARSCTVVPPSTLPSSSTHMDSAEYDFRNVITSTTGPRAIDACNLLFRKLS